MSYITPKRIFNQIELETEFANASKRFNEGDKKTRQVVRSFIERPNIINYHADPTLPELMLYNAREFTLDDLARSGVTYLSENINVFRKNLTEHIEHEVHTAGNTPIGLINYGFNSYFDLYTELREAEEAVESRLWDSAYHHIAGVYDPNSGVKLLRVSHCLGGQISEHEKRYSHKMETFSHSKPNEIDRLDDIQNYSRWIPSIEKLVLDACAKSDISVHKSLSERVTDAVKSVVVESNKASTPNESCIPFQISYGHSLTENADNEKIRVDVKKKSGTAVAYCEENKYGESVYNPKNIVLATPSDFKKFHELGYSTILMHSLGRMQKSIGRIKGDLLNLSGCARIADSYNASKELYARCGENLAELSHENVSARIASLQKEQTEVNARIAEFEKKVDL